MTPERLRERRRLREYAAILARNLQIQREQEARILEVQLEQQRISAVIKEASDIVTARISLGLVPLI